MIIKGGAAGNIAYWTNHLLRDDTNESVRVVELKGVASEDLSGALREMKAIGAQSRSKGNSLYQANINPRPDEELNQAQFLESVDIIERNLGFIGHQRVVVEHVKNGRRHYHVIWNRVDCTTLKVAGITGNYRIHEQTARQVEERFGLGPIRPHAKGKRRRPELWEYRASERSGIDPAKVTDEITRLWFETTTGTEFRKALEDAGYILAKGDRRDFCIVDRAGDVHSLARRLRSVRVDEVRKRLADIDRDKLPTVAEARERQRRTARDAKRRGLGAGFQGVGGKVMGRGRRNSSKGAATQSEFRGAAGRVTRAGSSLGLMKRGLRRSQPGTLRQAGRALTNQMPRRDVALPPVSSPTPEPTLSASSLPAPLPLTMPSRPRAGFDKAATGRANAAFDAEYARWQTRIDAVLADRSLSPDQREAALFSLRTQQRVEAEGARRRVIEEEEQRVRAVKRAARAALTSPPKPGR